ncbi:MAG: RlmF-related methyltransferase [Candidatus Kariarchaeaceae archaeon]|jgi:methylase of polypeptide subunit release factors
MRLLDHDEIDITPWCIRLDPAASLSPSLEKFRDERGRIDLGKAEALNAYNLAALKVMADLDITLPDGHLVPTACLRQAYLTILMDGFLERGDSILEIGTGASAVISLVATANHGLSVTATELDEASYLSAQHNITTNGYTDQITLLRSCGEVITGLVPPRSYRAVLCYPPTYPENDRHLYEEKRSSGFRGSTSEMIGGGDEGFDFIEQYLREAVEADIELITVLLIFESHVQLCLDLLRDLGGDPKMVRLKAGMRTRYLVHCRM